MWLVSRLIGAGVAGCIAVLIRAVIAPACEVVPVLMPTIPSLPSSVFLL